MKRNNINAIVVLIIIVALGMFISSCSIEKRRYMSGYNIQWNSKVNTDKIEGVALQREAEKNSEEVKIEASSELEVSDTIIRSAEKPLLHASAKSKQITVAGDQKIEGELVVKNMEAKSENNHFQIEKKKNPESSSNSSFLIFAGLLASMSLLLYKIGINKAKRISYWASKNKWKSRSLLVVANAGLATLGYYTGKEMFDAGISISTFATNITMGVGAIAALMYPFKNVKSGILKHSYRKQKLYDLALSTAGFLLMAGIGNQNAMDKHSYALEASTVESHSKYVEQSDKQFNADKEYVLNQYKSKVKPEGSKSKSPMVVRLAIISAGVFLFIFLELLVLTLSCSFMCSGFGPMAFVVLLGGTILNIFLCYKLVVSANRGPSISESSPQNDISNPNKK